MKFILIYLFVIKLVFQFLSRVPSYKCLTHLGTEPRAYCLVNTQQIFVELNFYYPLCSFWLKKKNKPSFPIFVSKDSTNIFSLGLKTLGKHLPRSLQPVSAIDKKYTDSNCTHHWLWSLLVLLHPITDGSFELPQQVKTQFNSSHGSSWASAGQ